MNSPMKPRRGVSPRVVAGVVLVLAGLVGAVAGMALDRTVLSPCQEDGASRGRRVPYWARSGEEHRERWLKVSRSLNLSPAQTAAIDSILAEQARELELARKTVEPGFREIMHVTRERIDAVLTAEQKQQLEDQRQAHRRERGRGPRKD